MVPDSPPAEPELGLVGLQLNRPGIVVYRVLPTPGLGVGLTPLPQEPGFGGAFLKFGSRQVPVLRPHWLGLNTIGVTTPDRLLISSSPRDCNMSILIEPLHRRFGVSPCATSRFPLMRGGYSGFTHRTIVNRGKSRSMSALPPRTPPSHPTSANLRPSPRLSRRIRV